MPARSLISARRSNRPIRRSVRRHLNHLLESLESRVMLSLTPGNISGVWNFAGIDAQGSIQFDDANNVVGGQITSSDGSTSTPTGTYAVTPNGSFALTIDGQTFTGAANTTKDSIVFTQQTGIMTFGVLFKQTATTFSTADLNGTWSIFLSGDAPDNTGGGSVVFDGLGNITGGTQTDIDGITTITGGTYEVATTGQFTVNVTISSLENPDDIVEFSGWLNDAKDTLALNPTDLMAAANDGDTRILIANAHAATYTAADLNNTWTIVGDGFTGSINFNGAGVISGGGGFDNNNNAFSLSGTYSIIANGTAAGLVTLNISQLPTSDGSGPVVLHGSLNTSKNLLAIEQTPFDNGDTGETSSDSLVLFVNAGNHAPTLSSIATLSPVDPLQPVDITFAQLLAASNAADADSDPLNFQVTSLGAGTFLLNDSPAPEAPFFFSPDDALQWTPLHGTENSAAFSVKAFDGTAYSNVAVPVTVAGNGFLPFLNQDFSGSWTITTHNLDGFITLNGSGGVTGGSVTGNTFDADIGGDNYTVNSDGTLEIHLTGASDDSLYDGIGSLNSTGDLAVTTSPTLPTDTDDGSTNLAVFLNHAGTFANSNVAGTWNFSTDDVRGSFTADAAGHLSGSFITINDAGSATVNGTILGTSSYILNASTGDCTVVINTSLGDSLAFSGFIDSSKDVLALHTDPDPDAEPGDDRSLYAVKHSGTYSKADLFGQYALSSDGIRGTFIADGAGHILSSSVTDSSGNPLTISGTYTVTSAGIVTLSISAVSSDGTQTLSFTGGLNASKNVALLGRTSLSAAQLINGNDFDATFLVRSNIQPLVSVTATDATAAESGVAATSKATFTISRLGSTADPLTIHFTTDGSAERGTDYTLSTGNVTLFSSVVIPAGDSSIVVTLTAIDDDAVESTESAILSLGDDPAYTLTSDKSTATVNITDNEPVISITANKPTASETNNTTTAGVGQFTLTRTGGSNAGPLTINYIMEGSAHNGTDFTTLSGTASFAAGASTVTINIVPIDDALVENTENISLTVVTNESNSYTVNSLKEIATVTIADNEPIISIKANKPTASETNNGISTGVGQFTLTRTGGNNAGPLAVTYMVSGTADNGTDFITLSGTANFAAGASTVVVNVVPVDDAVAELPETVTLTVIQDSGPSYTVNDSKNAATITITDNEPTISITAKKPTASETNNGTTTGVGQFTFTRAGGNNAGPLAVTYTVSGTTDDGDFISLSGTANFAAGASTVTVNVVPINDSFAEPTESVILTVSASQSYTVASNKSTATVNITDNEPTISITANKPTASETNNTTTTGVGQFTFTRAGGSNVDPLTVTYTISGGADNGTDFISLSGTANFAAGASTVTVNVVPVNDSLAEPAESVILTVSTSQSYTVASNKSTATVTITDNEPIISITAKKPAASETTNGTSTGVGQFILTRTGGSNVNALSVNYTLSGSADNTDDYLTLSGTANFAAGASTVIVNITPVNDTLGEGSETAILTVSTSQSYTVASNKSTATVTIADNEPIVSITASKPAAAELNGTTTGAGQFKIARTGSTAEAMIVHLTITGTADNGTDYANISNTVTIPAGALSALVAVQPTDDFFIEGSQSVTLGITPDEDLTYQISDTHANATVTIADHNRPPTIGVLTAITGAHVNTVFPISHIDLVVATSALDPEHVPLVFKITSIKSGTLLKNGTPATAGTTVTNSDTLMWTPANNAVGTLAAFAVSVSDGVTATAPVTISVVVTPAV